MLDARLKRWYNLQPRGTDANDADALVTPILHTFLPFRGEHPRVVPKLPIRGMQQRATKIFETVDVRPAPPTEGANAGMHEVCRVFNDFVLNVIFLAELGARHWSPQLEVPFALCFVKSSVDELVPKLEVAPEFVLIHDVLEVLLNLGTGSVECRPFRLG